MFPDFTVPDTAVKGKTLQETREQWCKDIAERLDRYRVSIYDDTKQKDYDNFNAFNGTYSDKQFSYITDLYGKTNPARFVNYPIMQHIIESLIGEFLSQPLEFECEAVNEDAVYAKYEQKVQFVFQAL